MEITQTQLFVLIGYSLSIYGFKFLVEQTADEGRSALLRSLIPAFNLIAGLVLGFFGLAEFDITVAVIGTLATGGAADLIKLPKKVSNVQR